MYDTGMVITQTPFRLSFFGGGTDFPDYFNQYGGIIMSAAINKYLYVAINSLQRFYEQRIRLSYSKLEVVSKVEDLQHDIVRTILTDHLLFGPEHFLDMHTFADLPASCGMGSSSAFTVGFLYALYALNNIYKIPEEIVYEAIHIEREKLKDAGGWQDQVCAGMGGFNLIHFRHNIFTVEPILLSQKKRVALEQSCLLFFTGNMRSSAAIQKYSMQLTEDKIQQLHIIKQQALAAVSVLQQAQKKQELIAELGALLNISWKAKRKFSQSSTSTHIDLMYAAALKAGAVGAKLCGAGGEGFLLTLVPEEKKNAVINALAPLKYLTICFDDLGCRLLYGHQLQ